jgi:DNA polymerase
MSYLYLDFETRSTVDLKKVGLYVYAHHPTTKIVCFGLAVDEDPIFVYSKEIELFDMLHLWHDPSVTIVAHNAPFEREMLRACGFNLPWSRFVDTAALAARMALPRKLEAVAEALKLEEQKDVTGHKIMLRLARPKGGWSDDEFWEEEDRPADFAALREYCRQDVLVMREIHRRLLPLSATERRLYELTGEMNDRGVPVDLASVPLALEVLEKSTVEEVAEFKRLAGGHPVKSYKKVAEALGLENMRKVTVRNAIRDPTLSPEVRRACEIFKKLARSSPAKLKAFQQRASADGRVRGALIYGGAERTTRWSSGGVQLHNMPKGLGEGTDTVFDALAAGCLELCYDDPVGTIAEALRGFLVGPFYVGDFAQIEARSLNWFAGQADMLDLFREKKDPYLFMARKIAGKDSIGKNDADPRFPPGVTWRFIGKTTVLGAGYGLGWAKFQRTLDEIYDVQLDEAFCMRVIETYRMTSHHVVAWWAKLEKGFTQVVTLNEPRLQVDSRIAMGNIVVEGLRYAYIELPSGRRLYYAEPEMTVDGIRYWGRDIYLGGKWNRVTTYGGKLAENIVQAFSRDVMAEAMIRLDAKGFPLLLTVHDEIVSEKKGLLSDFHDTMMVTPSWAEGLPIDVETFETHRYRK